MREILFRAKDNGVLNGVWQYGSLDISNPDAPTIIRIDRHNNKMFIPILIETVGQYTGLTDKNGKKIFEGDIIDIQYPDIFVANTVVEYVGASFVASTDYDAWALDDFVSLEVIGNIHDNPELLKGGE